MPRVSGVVLAGGKSRRMGGSPKGLLTFGEAPLIRHIVQTLESVLPESLVVTNTPELYAFLGRPMVADVYPDGGSLGGIYSGLLAAPGEGALCVACDMPFLSRDLLAYLASRAGEADVVIPDAAGELHTLHAVYAKACLPAMRRQLESGRLRITGFFEDVRVLRLPPETVAAIADPDLALMNLNTPADLARARMLWRAQATAPGGPRG